MIYINKLHDFQLGCAEWQKPALLGAKIANTWLAKECTKP